MIDVHFDFETFSEADIKKVGGWVYSQHPSTEVICMAYAYNDGDPHLWLPGENFRPWFLYPERAGEYNLHAWNSAFEYGIIKNVLKIEPMPLDYWMDTQAMATAMALPAKLGQCGEALGVSQDKAKDKRGAYLIKRLCSPQGKKRTRIQDPELLEEFYEYCKRDVIAERYIHNNYLMEFSLQERELWKLDQEINFRGIQIDIPNVHHAMAIHQKKTDSLMQELREITGVENPNSWQQFLPWAKEQGYTGENMQAQTIEDFVEEMKK